MWKRLGSTGLETSKGPGQKRVTGQDILLAWAKVYRILRLDSSREDERKERI